MEPRVLQFDDNPFDRRTQLREWALFRACITHGLFCGVEAYREQFLDSARQAFEVEVRRQVMAGEIDLAKDKIPMTPTHETLGAYLRESHGQFRPKLRDLGWIVEPPGQSPDRPTADGKEHDGRLWGKML